MKKVICILSCLAIVFSLLPAPVYATELEEEHNPVIEHGAAVWNAPDDPNGPRYHYRSEPIIAEGDHTTLVDYDIDLENQPTNGTYIGPNDSLSYVTSSGLTVSTGFTYNLPPTLPAPLSGIAVSVNVSFDKGSFNGSGYVANGGSVHLGAGQAPGYYRLHLIKTMQIKPYVVLRKPVGTSGEWVVDHTGYLIIDPLVELTPYLKFIHS